MRVDFHNFLPFDGRRPYLRKAWGSGMSLLDGASPAVTLHRGEDSVSICESEDDGVVKIQKIAFTACKQEVFRCPPPIVLVVGYLPTFSRTEK